MGWNSNSSRCKLMGTQFSHWASFHLLSKRKQIGCPLNSFNQQAVPPSTSAAASTYLSMSGVCGTAASLQTNNWPLLVGTDLKVDVNTASDMSVFWLWAAACCFSPLCLAVLRCCEHFREEAQCCLRLAAGSVTSRWAEAWRKHHQGKCFCWGCCCKSPHCHLSSRIGHAGTSALLQRQKPVRHLFNDT